MFKCFKRSFIRQFYIKKVKIKFVNILYYINLLIPKDSKSIVAFVDYEDVNGSLMPYNNDNVYIVCEHIKKIEPEIKITYIPSNQFGGKINKTLGKKQKLIYLFKRFNAKILLFKQPPHMSGYYTHKQHLICFGYFIPFKSDYWELQDWTLFYKNILDTNFSKKSCEEYREDILTHFTYHKEQFDKTNLIMITTSEYAANAISISHNLKRDIFKILGSPKSDKVSPCIDTIQEVYGLKNSGQKIVLYTPTFRDVYMHNKLENMKQEDQSIFGYINEVKILEPFLKKNNILIIIKLHKSFPYYRSLEKKFMRENKSYFDNCFFLDFEVESNYNISVYNLFEQSDAMIADYSSISFDYLPYDKPIIYNVPDLKDYQTYRGFSYEPIEDMMPGDKALTIEDLKRALLRVKSGTDCYINKRKEVLSVVNEVPQGKAMDNILNYIKKLT